MKKELDLNAMEQVNGGVLHTVDTGIDGVDAVIRSNPSKSSRQIGNIPNGTQVDTVRGAVVTYVYGEVAYDKGECTCGCYLGRHCCYDMGEG